MGPTSSCSNFPSIVFIGNLFLLPDPFLFILVDTLDSPLVLTWCAFASFALFVFVVTGDSSEYWVEWAWVVVGTAVVAGGEVSVVFFTWPRDLNQSHYLTILVLEDILHPMFICVCRMFKYFENFCYVSFLFFS